MLTCVDCGAEFHRSDFAPCPYKEGGWICSYCCMSELDCGTMCRKGSVSVSFVQLSPE